VNGTPISIQNVKIGDKIKNNFHNYTEVVKTWEYDVDEEMVELEFEDGRIIKCTKAHEIYTLNRGWVKADDLTEKDDISEIKLKCEMCDKPDCGLEPGYPLCEEHLEEV